MTDDNTSPLIEKDTYLHKQSASFGFWGATEDMWLEETGHAEGRWRKTSGRKIRNITSATS